MSEWITDRRPTEDDAHAFDFIGYVWVTTEHGIVLRQRWDQVRDRPWMPIARPEPYVKPKRWEAKWNGTWWSLYYDGEWQECLTRFEKQNDQHREAAERIAAIYEEVMP